VQHKEYTWDYWYQPLLWATEETYTQSKIILIMLKKLATKIIFPQAPQERSEAINSLAGPVAFGDIITHFLIYKVPPMLFIVFMALVSINLGVFNLLPLPALDG
jgi:membrane-associated protease RseP (regulator of RpoE activity)